jgi:cyclophilin family peptidyl-prolyl cis-trans isomerase
MSRPPFVLALLATALLALAGCGGKDDKKAKPAATTDTTAAQQGGCQRVAAPAPKSVGKVAKPTEQLTASKTYTATIVTNCGTFALQLDSRRAPRTGGSFAYLARKGFFDGLAFHRVVSGFVIQGGDPKGNGTGGPGYKVVESPPRSLRYVRGVAAMAKTEIEKPGTSGSQFFVVTGEDAQLPPDYALLGKVSRGQDVVERIGAVQTDAQDKPVSPVVIEKVTISES